MQAASELLKGPPPAKSLIALFEATAARRGDAPAIRHKRGGAWVDVSWAEVARRARDVSDGLAALGLQPGDRVAIIGETQIEWILADMGILGAGGVTVTIYQSNTADECAFILGDSGARWVFCDTALQAAKVQEVRGRLPGLQGIICAAGGSADGFQRSLGEVERLGAEWRTGNPGAHAARVGAIGLEDAASVIYTSGTTGNPKGVVLTHRAWVYEAQAVEQIQLVLGEDVILLFLPMAHSFAKVVEAVWISTGSVLAFVESLDRIADNAGEVRPTVMPAVPRIFEKAYNTIVSKGMGEHGIKGALFRMSMEGFDAWVTARAHGRKAGGFGLLVARKLVFPKVAATVKARFGGRLRLCISGAAPLSTRIAHFFDAVGLVILEGYGLTETAAGTIVNRPGQNRIGTVGQPIPGTEVRIADDGEIFIKGGGVMKEYYRNPAATAEVLQDGWLATGDIGEIDEAGCVRITDRKKDIIVTAGGKNVAPQNLENELKADPLVSQVVVHGDRRKFLSALVTLNPEHVEKWAAQNGVTVPPDRLHEDPRVRERIQRSIDALNAHQASYSTIKRFAILPRELTQEAGEITPTLKVKRKVVSERYREILDAFYAE
ncbi:MAG TPA: long-chain fatty acid--CoA ligase [Anaeromyxobacteraceae bacterium]|nr:long-chain fatty acid--CoA ligase [Anaeromyxobacteraceae bacterium]